MRESFTVRFIRREEFAPAMDLCWKVFGRFEAALYGPEGTDSFRRFIYDEKLFQVFLAGGFPVAAAFERDRMIGVGALRSGPHLSLLFVEEEYQRMGVGRALMDYLVKWLAGAYTGLGIRESITVNSSPVGVPFYRTIGFAETGPAVTKDGIYYIPMELRFKRADGGASKGDGNDH